MWCWSAGGVGGDRNGRFSQRDGAMTTASQPASVDARVAQAPDAPNLRFLLRLLEPGHLAVPLKEDDRNATSANFKRARNIVKDQLYVGCVTE
jgi:hypothetical protein